MRGLIQYASFIDLYKIKMCNPLFMNDPHRDRNT